MRKNRSFVTPFIRETAITLLIVFIGLFFIWFMYANARNQNHSNALQSGTAIATVLPVEKIAQLNALPGDTSKQEYKELKSVFQALIKENNNARFAYLYIQRTGKCYFLLDSEPPASADYSPPGQEYTEAAEVYKQPFLNGKSLITSPQTDRWGTWISILVPVKNNQGKTLAVFAMDINAKSWNRTIWQQVAESSLLVIVVLMLWFIALRYISKNRRLESEINVRLDTAKALSESEERYRLLYENASIGIYRTTPDGQVLLSNKALVKMLGYKSFEELKQRDIDKDEFDPDYSRAEFKKVMEEKGEIYGLEDTWKRQDGEMVYIRENAKAVRDNRGKVIYYDGTIEDVTDRKLAEKALQYSEERFRQIAEQSREVGWEVDKNGLYTYISPLSESVLEYKPDELVGKKHFFDLHPEGSREDFRKTILEGYQRKENFHDYISQMIKGNGDYIWVINNGVPIVDEMGELIGYRGAGSDITERIEKEKLLKKLTLAVEQSPVSIILTDINGSIEYGNPKACETTGYQLSELIGQNPRILKSADSSEATFRELWDTISSGHVWNGELLNKKKNGELYRESATVSPIFDDEGNIINYLAVKEDITNIKKLVSELQAANEKAESIDLLKSAFIKNISHEIRTPLNGIVGMSEQIVKPGVSQPDKEQMLAYIRESSMRLLNTVNSYLDISLIVSGNADILVQDFDLNQLLTDIKNEISRECLSKNLDLQLQIHAEPESFTINTDSDILHKILMHLLNNAVKFTETGFVNFGYEVKKDEIEFLVKDSGIGIEKSFLPVIFEVFTQADVSDTRSYEGSGLGLSIAFHLTHLLSGEIRVESEKGKGTSFFLTFPINNLT
jgi:hypothetical protein